MTDIKKEEYEKIMSVMSCENINKNLIKKGLKTDKKFYQEYKLPDNRSYY